jgi:hypothetical protein
MPRKRWSLDLTDWPPSDQQAWARAVRSPASSTPGSRWADHFLLRDRRSAALWLMPDGTDMTRPAFYYYFCKATNEELSKKINPHFVRKIMATGVSICEPKLVEIIQHVLDHTSDDTRKEWYDLADRLAASRRYIELLEARRRPAIDSMLEEEGNRTNQRMRLR